MEGCESPIALEGALRRGPADVVVVGPAFVDRPGLRRLASFHHLAPRASIVLAVSQRPDAALREIIRAGADDLLALPADESELAMALERAVRIGRRRCVSPTVTAQPLQAPTQGQIVTIASPTGGCGKSFLATNTALFLARATGKRVILVDLDLQFGEVSVALRLRAGFTIADLVRGDDPERDFEEHLSEFLVEHDTGFSVLAAPKDPAEADAITPADITRILEALRSRADYVVVDTPGALNETVLAALDLTDRLVVMGTPDPPSVRNVGVYLDTMRKLGVQPERVSLILNKADAETAVLQTTRLLPQPIDGVLPYSPEASRSVNLGVPLLALSPKCDVAQQLASALRSLLPHEQRAEMEEPAPARHRWKVHVRRRRNTVSVASQGPAAAPASPLPTETAAPPARDNPPRSANWSSTSPKPPRTAFGAVRVNALTSGSSDGPSPRRGPPATPAAPREPRPVVTLVGQRPKRGLGRRRRRPGARTARRTPSWPACPDLALQGRLPVRRAPALRGEPAPGARIS